MNDLIHRYSVRLDNGSIFYIGKYRCEDCHWVDNDLSYFTEIDNRLYCSLHIPKKGSRQ